jgi:nitrogen regulatory protein P-II 1
MRGARLGSGAAALPALIRHTPVPHQIRTGGFRFMKLIIAIIQPARLEALKQELGKAGVFGLTVTGVQGAGRQKGHTEIYRGHEYEVSLVTKVKVEIAVDDFRTDAVVAAVTRAARTGEEGKIGDGKIFIVPVEEVVRIRTGEVGAAAL